MRDDVVDDVEKRGLEGDGGHHVGAQKSGAEEELALGGLGDEAQFWCVDGEDRFAELGQRRQR